MNKQRDLLRPYSCNKYTFVLLLQSYEDYDKDGSFDIPEPLYQALCDASIKAQLARLHSLGNECKLSFTVPAQIKKAAEDELNAIINDWK
jgi:hypothetical protein